MRRASQEWRETEVLSKGEKKQQQSFSCTYNINTNFRRFCPRPCNAPRSRLAIVLLSTLSFGKELPSYISREIQIPGFCLPCATCTRLCWQATDRSKPPPPVFSQEFPPVHHTHMASRAVSTHVTTLLTQCWPTARVIPCKTGDLPFLL